jgi:putative ABC transport system permease protein
MFKHVFKIAVRNFLRNKSFAFINIFGLSFGLTTFILIALFVRYEFSWDKFHKDYNSIFRLQVIAHMADGDQHWSQIGYPIGNAMRDQYPEIEHAVVTRPVWGEYLSSSEKLTFHEENGQYVQPSFYDVFTVEFIEGTAENSLTEPYSIVLTESLKNKYFGEDSALGKFIKAKNRYELKVTGVIKDFPENSSMDMDYLSPIKLLDINETWSNLDDQWDNFTYFTYIKLNPEVSQENFDQKISNYLKESEHFKDNPTKYTLWANELTSLHLLPDPQEEGLLIIVYLYGGVAIFALIIACINFMNMTTAYSVARAKEIGIKKVVGSTRMALSRQFLFESIFVALISMHIAFVLAEFALPYFNTIVARQLNLSFITDWPFILFIVGITLVTGIISGAYPAFVLSRFQPSRALKNASSLSNTRSPLRKVLVTFQFTISTILILSTILIYKQFNFMKNKELGFDKESVMYAYIGAEEKKDSRRFNIIKNRLVQIPELKSASVSWNIPFHSSSGSNVTWEGAQPDETINARYNFVGHDYFDTYGLKLVEGRFFSRDIVSDSSDAIVINETAARVFGWDNPIDKEVEFWGKDYKVIGIVKDFHPFSVFQTIPPFVFRLHDEEIDHGMNHSVKIADGVNILEAKAKITALYKEIFPDTLFDFKYYGNEMDDTVSVIYNGIVKTFLFFSLITISIAVVGMFGLVAFSTKSRTKEIGIRKVHGATVKQVFVLLASEFVVLIIIAIVIAMPAGFGFKAIDPAAYKAETEAWEYITTGLIVILVTLLTITWHTRKASKQNPSEALRYE